MSYYVRDDGIVDLERVEKASTAIHVVLQRQVEARELERHLEARLGVPVYCSVYFDTEEPQMDVYANASVEKLIGALGKSEKVLRAKVKRE